MSKCGNRFSACECVMEADHETEVCQCDCGGSWKYNEEGLEVPVTYPGGLTFGQAVVADLYADPVLRML